MPARAEGPAVTWRGRRVLVTGGAGFIGSHLVEGLVARRASVIVVDTFVTGLRENLRGVAEGVEVHELDLRTDDLRPLLRESAPDAVFHLAANGYVPPSVEDPRWDMETNVVGTFNLLEALRGEASRPHLVYTSTAAVYAEGLEQPLREDYPTRPPAPYGVSKLAAERYVAVYAQVFGLRASSVRLFPVFGPRLRKQVVYDLMCKLRANPHELALHGDGTQVRDFTYVTNVVEALLAVSAHAPADGGVYNVGMGEGVAIADLARLLCERLGATPRIVYSGQVRPGEAQRWVADITRLRALGYHPQVRLADGLAATARWFDDQPSTSAGAASVAGA